MDVVRNIMQTDVVTTGPEMSVYELSKLFAEHNITGAPVVNVEGEVLGVVSMTDVIRLAADETDIRVAPRPFITAAAALADAEAEEEEDLVYYFRHISAPGAGAGPAADWATESDLDRYDVRSIMTPANFYVAPDATLGELAGFLLRGRIHRALVMEDDKLVGIVTTVDVLRAVADPP
jgi:CBS domain-containing protein